MLRLQGGCLQRTLVCMISNEGHCAAIMQQHTSLHAHGGWMVQEVGSSRRCSILDSWLTNQASKHSLVLKWVPL